MRAFFSLAYVSLVTFPLGTFPLTLRGVKALLSNDPIWDWFGRDLVDLAWKTDFITFLSFVFVNFPFGFVDFDFDLDLSWATADFRFELFDLRFEPSERDLRFDWIVPISLLFFDFDSGKYQWTINQEAAIPRSSTRTAAIMKGIKREVFPDFSFLPQWSLSIPLHFSAKFASLTLEQDFWYSSLQDLYKLSAKQSFSKRKSFVLQSAFMQVQPMKSAQHLFHLLLTTWSDISLAHSSFTADVGLESREKCKNN